MGHSDVQHRGMGHGQILCFRNYVSLLRYGQATVDDALVAFDA